MKEKILDRFIRYAKVETRSDENSKSVPSTPNQLVLGKILAEELKVIGMQDIRIEKSGNVIATLPANISENVPVIGFISHMDTADFNAVNVNPQVIYNYDGEVIILNKERGIDLNPAVFPNLKNYVGHTLITTDGTTLLGADDKAGITEILSAMDYLIHHPEIPHGTVRIAFTIDEEIGYGAQSFDVPAFDADFAYTVDGGPLGELEYETFNAAAATVTFKGVSVHPGTAKDKMINAITLAREFAGALPEDEVPEKTEGTEGFYLLSQFNGTIEETVLSYIIRDHDHEIFEQRKQTLVNIQNDMNQHLGYPAVSVELRDQYYNMADIIAKDMSIVTLARKAMANLGIEAVTHPVRGGTDGSQLSYMGLPTPNLFTGGENFHGKYEFASLDDMEKAMNVIIEIIKLNALKKEGE